MIEGIRNPQVETLCLSAEADESTLQYPFPEHIFGFHSQQSVEKLLKALVSVHGQSHPRTQSVEQLLNWLAELDEILPDLPFDLSLLEPYSVLFHYEFGVNSLPKRDVVAVLERYVFACIVELQGSSETEG